MKKLWYWLNATFGERRYLKIDGTAYIKEGFNKPEPLLEHLKSYHPDEYSLLDK